MLRLFLTLQVQPANDQIAYILRYEGPLGTFSSRTEVAYLFGGINRTIAEQLTLIREMRNACAHSKFKLSFDAPELANVAKRLFKPLGVTPLNDQTGEGIRRAFYIETMVIYQTLYHGSRQVAVQDLIERFSRHTEQPPSPDKSP